MKDNHELDGYEEHEIREREILHLTLDDGSEIDCLVIGTYAIEDKDYIALLTEEEDVFLYRYVETDEEQIEIINIEDELEFEKASEVFFELFVDEE